MANIPAPLSDAVADMVDGMRDAMTADQVAVFDLAVALELLRRGLAPEQFHLELNAKAEVHRARAPYTAALIKSLSKHIAPKNVVALPRNPQP